MLDGWEVVGTSYAAIPSPRLSKFEHPIREDTEKHNLNILIVLFGSRDKITFLKYVVLIIYHAKLYQLAYCRGGLLVVKLSIAPPSEKCLS